MEQEKMSMTAKAAHKGWLFLLLLCASNSIGGVDNADSPPRCVRIVYLVSADRTVREDFKKAIETAAKDLQTWYAKQLRGPTFRLHDPVVEVAKSDKAAGWFYSHANGEREDDWGSTTALPKHDA